MDLYRMRLLMRQLAADERNVAAAMARATHITQGFSDMPHAPGVTDRVGMGVIELEEATRVRDATLAELTEMRAALRPMVAALPVTTQAVMAARYLEGEAPTMIAIHQHMSERNVWYLLHKGEAQIRIMGQGG